jgi:hypothetical protein
MISTPNAFVRDTLRRRRFDAALLGSFLWPL